MNVQLEKPSGNASPLNILKAATAHWRERGGSTEVLRELTLDLENAERRISADKVPEYLARLTAHPQATTIGFTLPAEAQALLDASAVADEALFTTDAPDMVPQEPEPLSELGQAALAYARQGWPVFPVVEGAKRPACEHGYQDATTDEQKIRAWWIENPNYNVGCYLHGAGLCAVDQDTGGDVAALNITGLTREHATPSGGTHFLFEGELPSSAGKLAPHVDSRGLGGYIVMPPSIVNGKAYRVAADRSIAKLPAHILAALAPKVGAATSSVPDLDLPGNVSAARTLLRDLVRRGAVAIEGQHGDNFTYQVACRVVRDYGLSEGKALELLEAEFNPHCKPPWSREELAAKVERAATYGQNEAGAYATGPASEVFANAPVDKISNANAGAKGEQDTLDNDPGQERDIARWLKRLGGSRPIEDIGLPAPQWWDNDKTIQRGDPEGYVVLYQGGKGVLKTYITISKLTALVREKKARVAYCAGEGSYGVRSVRVPAIAKAHNVSLEDMSKRWVTYKAVPNLFDDSACEAFCQSIDRDFPEGVDFIVIDTLGQASPGQDMNAPGYGTALTERTKFLRERYSCVLILIHHLGKDPKRGALGSTMIIADPGTVCEFRKIKGSPNMREEWVHHVREGEADRSLGYEIKLTASSQGIMAPVPMRVADHALIAAKAKEARKNNPEGEKELMQIDYIREYLIEQGAFDNIETGLTASDAARAVFYRAREAQGLPTEPRNANERAGWDAEIEALRVSLTKKASRQLHAKKGPLLEVCGWGKPLGNKPSSIRWFVKPDSLRPLANDPEDDGGELEED